MDTKKVWAGEFGDDYHRRNWVDWQKRVPFFKHILELTGARSVLEFGCGPGWNLSACKRAFTDVEVMGHEINEEAEEMARHAGLLGVRDWDYKMSTLPEAELVFTVGCLIHIPPADIEPTMKSLIDKSYKYVMAVEYEAAEETEIKYRGQMGLLWKRPYGEMYQELGLSVVETGKLQQDVGFDNCRYWLMEK